MRKLPILTECKWIYTFQKNSKEEIRAYIKVYGGYKVVDFRVWRAWGGNAPRAMRKGLTIPLCLLPKMKKAIELIEEKIERDYTKRYSNRRERL